LVQSFNLKPEDYKRFLSFLRKHECHMPFQRFRSLPVRLTDEEPRYQERSAVQERSSLKDHFEERTAAKA
jgi:hypothetical protein